MTDILVNIDPGNCLEKHMYMARCYKLLYAAHKFKYTIFNLEIMSCLQNALIGTLECSVSRATVTKTTPFHANGRTMVKSVTANPASMDRRVSVRSHCRVTKPSERVSQ